MSLKPGNAKPQLGAKAVRAKPGIPSAPSGFENLVTNISETPSRISTESQWPALPSQPFKC